MANPTEVTVRIEVAGVDVTPLVVWSRTSFQVVASAHPGTCTITLREPRDIYEERLIPTDVGHLIKLYLDDVTMWQGYLFTMERGYVFAADTDRQWVLSGVDLNILFDKLILYNHAKPQRSLDGGGYYKRVKTEGGYMVTVPRGTWDDSYIRHMLDDTDLDLVKPTIRTQKIQPVAVINPDGKFAPPTPGLTLRAFMEDVSANVMRGQPGSVIWYIDPEGYLIYRETDFAAAPFWVGDDDPAADLEMVRNLTVTTDISRIKNDVLIFTGNLNPDPTSTQSRLLYRHKIDSGSVSRYGRFQYSEILSSSWLQSSINARANKLVAQEGTPASRAEFTTYRPGLYPGQIVTIHSGTHTFNWYDPVLGYQSGNEILLPIRSITYNFLNPNNVEYRVSCSVDTQDPWGLVLALKRPPSRGLTQAPFQIIDLTDPDQQADPAETYTLVKEWPRSLGGNLWQCSYAYIRYSLIVFLNGSRQVSVPEAGTTVGFKERDPDEGIFYCEAGSKKPYVEYHVWHDLDVQ